MAERSMAVWTLSLVVVALLLLPAGALVAQAPHAVPSASVHPAASTVRSPTLSAAPASTGLAATQARIVQSIQAAHVPSRDVFYPNFNAQEVRHGNVISPTYAHAPAPIGIADMGITNTTGTAVGSVLTTPSFEGSVTFNNLSAFYMDDDSTDYVGAQLNTVVANVTLLGNSSNSFWTQNVFEYSARSNFLQFIDNIWNFSSPAFYMSPNVFNATSPNGTLVAPSFYYGIGPVINITMPFTVNVFTNVSVTTVSGLPYDIVYFNYSLYKFGAWVQGGAYDWAIFNSQAPTSPTPTIATPLYQVNGVDLSPTGYLPYDAELVFCGPGGGSTTNLLNLNATLDLWYWNTSAGSYQTVPSAVAYGTNTGETADGIAEWYDATHTVHAGPGPTLPYLFWNSSPTASAGALTIKGPVTPTNAFVFVNQSVNYNESWAASAPVPLSGGISYRVPVGDYAVEVELSNYDPMNFTVLASTPSTWSLNANLVSDPARGVYTPLYAFSNAQLAAISTSGTGSSSSPYTIANNQVGSLDPIFARMNDFTFPTFSGLLLAHTTAYVDVANPASFEVTFSGRVLGQANALGLPTSNNLQIQLYGTSHVSLWNASGITGWFSGAYLTGFPIAPVMVWNSTNTLVGSNTFWDEGMSLLLYGGTANTVWGNRFLPSPNLADPAFVGAVMYGAYPFGPWVFENGDLIYNNAFETQVPVYSPASTIYTETYTQVFSGFWSNAWNVSWAPASAWSLVNGFNLTGSITGGSYQGGNFWWNYGLYGFYLPYDGGGLIAYGGDWLPLGGDSLAISETGLPANSAWSVTVNQLSIGIVGATSSIQLLDGTYDYAVSSVPGYTATPASGAVTLFQGPGAIVVTFAPVVTLYNVTLVEAGLPSGTSWTASLNGATASSTTSTLNWSEPNGSYTWAVTPIAGLELAHPGGTVSVAGAAASVAVLFTTPAAQSYSVAFVALGLPSGTTWSVTLAGTTVSSALGQISFTEPNGSYSYTIGTVTGYRATPSSGSQSVSGTASFVDVTFSPNLVTLSGTVTPSGATVSIDGAAVSVTGGAFSLQVAPGVHEVRATSSGYYDYINNVTVNVGQNLSVVVAMNAISGATTSGTSLSGANLALLAGLAVLAVIFLIGMVYFWSRARRAPVVMKPEPEGPSTKGPGTGGT